MATSLLWSPFFWQTAHTLTLVQTSLERPLSFFPQGGCQLNMLPLKMLFT